MIWPPFITLEACCGAVLGSFVTTAAMRRAAGRPWARGSSQCDGCGTRLGFYQTLPVVSYLGTRGRCSACGGAINPLHPLGEIAGALIVTSAFSLSANWAAIVTCALGLSLLYATIYDLLTLTIPNALNALILTLGGLQAFLAGRFWEGLASGALIYVAINLIRHLFAHFAGREGLGGGDVKLLAAVAFGVGAQSFSFLLICAAGLALLWVVVARIKGRSVTRLPFAPFVGLGWGLVFVGAALA